LREACLDLKNSKKQTSFPLPQSATGDENLKTVIFVVLLIAVVIFGITLSNDCPSVVRAARSAAESFQDLNLFIDSTRLE
jgi:hypothetical protein